MLLKRMLVVCMGASALLIGGWILHIPDIYTYILVLLICMGSYFILSLSLPYVDTFVDKHFNLSIYLYIVTIITISIIKNIFIELKPNDYGLIMEVIQTLNPLTTLLEIVGVILFYFGLKKLSHKINFTILSVIMSLLVVYMLNSRLVWEIHHHTAHFHSVFMINQGIPFSKDVLSTYGHYAFLMAPFFKIFGFNIVNYNLLLAILAGISFFNYSIVLNKIIDSKFYKMLGLFILLFCSTMFLQVWRGNYYAMLPYRIVFPSIMMLWAVFSKNNKSVTYDIIGYIIASLAIIWNPETGMVCLVAMSAFYFYQKSFTEKLPYLLFKIVSFTVLSVLFALILLNVFNLSLGGSLQGIQDLFYPVFSSFIDGLEMSFIRVFTVFSIGVSTLLIVLLYTISDLKIFNLSNTQKCVYNHTHALLFLNAVLGLLVFLYFVNRSAPFNAVIGSFQISISMIWLISKLGTNNIIPSKYKDVSFSLKIVGTTVLLFVAVANFSNLIYSKKLKNYYLTKSNPNTFITPFTNFIEQNIVDRKNISAIGSDGWTYAFTELGLKNNIPIADTTLWSWAYEDYRVFEILAESNPDRLFFFHFESENKGWFPKKYYKPEKMKEFLDNYNLIAEDIPNNMYYYEKKSLAESINNEKN